MNHDQEVHRHNIASEAYSQIWDKYERGALEHKSQLDKDYSALQLNAFAIEEAVDLFTYLYTQRDRITELEARIKELEAQLGK